MNEEGVARLFSTQLVDGPFSEHYEPVESPTTNVLHENVPVNPLIHWYDGVRETLATSGESEFPYACTVYRVVEREHFVTSNVPYLVEAMPDFFVEVPEGLAAEKGIENASQVRVWSKRGGRNRHRYCDQANSAASGQRADNLDDWYPGALGIRWVDCGLDGQPADAICRRCEHEVS